MPNQTAVKSVQEAVHNKLRYGGGVRCPRCGYRPSPNEEVLRVGDKTDAYAKVTFNEEGKLEDPNWEFGEIWYNEDTVA